MWFGQRGKKRREVKKDLKHSELETDPAGCSVACLLGAQHLSEDHKEESHFSVVYGRELTGGDASA